MTRAAVRELLEQARRLEAVVSPALRELLPHTEHPDPPVRAAFTRLLWKTPCDATFARLRAMVASETHPEVLTAIAHALGRYIWSGMQMDEYLDEEFGFAENVSSEQVTQARRMLLTMYDNTDLPLETRRTALCSLAFDPDEATISRIDALARSGDRASLISALECMGRSGLRRWHETIRTCLESEDSEVVKAAVDAAGEACLEAVETRVIALTEHPDRRVMLAAVWALRNVACSPPGRRRLFALTGSSDPEVAAAARRALVELEGLESEEDLERFPLRDGPEGV